MNRKKYWICVCALALIALLIHFFSSNQARVENYYSTGIYPFISVFLRHLFGWIPFSFGDILYGAGVFWILSKLAKFIIKLIRKEMSLKVFAAEFQWVPVTILLLYISFNALWGINYNRKGIASQLGLTMGKYSREELGMLNNVLLQKVNAASRQLPKGPSNVMSTREISLRSRDAYGELNKQYPFLKYQPASIKRSMWGWLGNYLGFLGYYNPFTGEGQVNTTIPKFLQPYTNCHEIAHQLGYAKENEANFVGYLAAASSKDVSFNYSVYLDLFLYANRNLFQTDSTAATAFIKQLLPPVKADLREWRQFIIKHKNPVEPVIRWLYGKYLENNQQPSGILSYDEVTGFLIAYYKKYGRL
ncbi:MAG: DUF3810 domain-containing protein [Ferruginibacter sp.]